MMLCMLPNERIQTLACRLTLLCNWAPLVTSLNMAKKTGIRRKIPCLLFRFPRDDALQKIWFRAILRENLCLRDSVCVRASALIPRTIYIYNLFQGQGQSQDSCNKRRDSRESEVLISASFKPRAVPRSIFVKCFPSLPRYKSPASESLRQTASTSAKCVEPLSSSLISVFQSSRLAAFS